MMRCHFNASFVGQKKSPRLSPSLWQETDEGRFGDSHNRLHESHLLRHHVSLTVWANGAAYACVPGAAEGSVAFGQ